MHYTNFQVLKHLSVKKLFVRLTGVQEANLSRKLDTIPRLFVRKEQKIYFPEQNKVEQYPTLEAYDQAVHFFKQAKKQLEKQLLTLLKQAPEVCTLHDYWHNVDDVQTKYPVVVLYMSTSYCGEECSAHIDLSNPSEVRVLAIESSKRNEGGLLNAMLAMVKHLFTTDFTGRTLVIQPEVLEYIANNPPVFLTNTPLDLTPVCQ